MSKKYKKTNKKLCIIGGDTFNFELVINGENEYKFLESKPLINSQNKEFGTVEMKKGKIYICINLPKFVRNNNIKPFSISDINMLEIINRDIEQALRKALNGIIENSTDVLAATVKSLECNITQHVSPNSTCAQVLNLINRSFHEGTNKVYQGSSTDCKYHKKDESVIINRKNYYILKCYDKSLEQRTSGNKEIKDGLLRIEVIMQKRILKKLFSDKSTIRNILTEQGLIKIIDEYKRIFINEFVEDHIKPCLRDVTNIIFESLKKTGSPIETIALHKELIMDMELLRTALKKWYKSKDKADYSRHAIKRLEEHDFPKDVVKTIKIFKKSCD